MQIPVINSSKTLSDDDVAHMVEACAAQLLECAAAWGIPPLAAAFYRTAATLPAEDVYICEIVDDFDQPGALGYHSDDVRPFIRVLAQGPATSITLSHEFLETLVDPTCDQWRPRGDGTQVALEVCDPVEGDSYGASVSLFGGPSRAVQLSNYVLPAWFDPGATGQVDRMGTVGKPFAMSPGGYMVVLDAQGNEQDVFARYGGLAGAATAGKRLATRNSRLIRRLRGRHV